MCGIAGLAGIARPPEVRTAALDLLAHRGPDGSGEWADDDAAIWLGHRRLAIVDLSPRGRQPMAAGDGRLQVTFNGEIYNYGALRRELEPMGRGFRSDADTEAILHAYDAWGLEALDRLHGMFAFALWDGQRRQLLLARDAVGIKPLYYAEVEGGLAFASELPALLRLLGRKPAVSQLALAYFLAHGYVPAPHTIWQGVAKLEPGHLMTWSSNAGCRVARFWEPPRHLAAAGAPRQRQEEWRALFDVVLREHLMADVPLGLFLSGGIDSSAVAVGLAKEAASLEALTIGYPGSDGDESAVAAATAAHLGYRHRRIPLGEAQVTDLLDRTAGAFSEPVAYSAIVSMYRLCQAAASGYKAVLAGDGGDEVFGGYTWYRQLGGHSMPGARQLRRAVGRPRRFDRARRRAAIAAHRAASPLHRHAWRLYPRFLPEEVEALLAPGGERFTDEHYIAPFARHDEPSLPLRRRLQRIDLMSFCADVCLPKVDIASMAFGLEVRVPFLDRRIVEWGLALPEDPREEAVGKPLLRDYLRDALPESVLAHPKQGFSLRVLDDFDWPAAARRIGDGPLVRQGYLAGTWRDIVAPDRPDAPARLWNLLVLTLWAERWL